MHSTGTSCTWFSNISSSWLTISIFSSPAHGISSSKLMWGLWDSGEEAGIWDKGMMVWVIISGFETVIMLSDGWRI